MDTDEHGFVHAWTHIMSTCSTTEKLHSSCVKSNRRNLVVFVLCIALVGLVFLFWNPEPSYGGKKLSQWLDGFNYHYHMTDESPSFIEFSDAIRQIGPEATPFLLDWIRYQPAHTNAKAQVAFLLGAVPDSLVPTRIRDWLDEEKQLGRAIRSVIAFQVLGTNALPLLPELSRLATTSANSDVSQRAIEAMYELGPPAIPTFLRVIRNPQAEGRYKAMLPLGSLGTNSQMAIP